jgi:hypothetical protein
MDRRSQQQPTTAELAARAERAMEEAKRLREEAQLLREDARRDHYRRDRHRTANDEEP